MVVTRSATKSKRRRNSESPVSDAEKERKVSNLVAEDAIFRTKSSGLDPNYEFEAPKYRDFFLQSPTDDENNRWFGRAFPSYEEMCVNRRLEINSRHASLLDSDNCSEGDDFQALSMDVESHECTRQLFEEKFLSPKYVLRCIIVVVFM